MAAFDRGKRRLFLFLAAIGFVILLVNLSLLSGRDLRSKIKKIPIIIPEKEKSPGGSTPPNPNVSPAFYGNNI
jgi:hypothetical protein